MVKSTGAKQYKEISAQFHTWDKPGDTLEGKYEGSTTIQIRKGQESAEVLRHQMRQDGGQVIRFLGGVQLDGLLSEVELGQEIKLVYQGKVKTSGGQMKDFKLFVAEVA